MKKSELTCLSKNKSITHCYIRKDGYYYKPSSRGYTDRIEGAGVYEKQEAISHAEHCKDISLVPIDVNQHNESIKKEVYDLLSRIIT